MIGNLNFFCGDRDLDSILFLVWIMKPPGLKISKTRFSNQDVSASQSQVFKRFFNNSNLSFSNKLEFETEERKKRVMDESLHCMFYNLPNAILDLSQLLTDLNHLYEQFYSNDDLIQGKVPTEKHKQMASLYQVIQPGLYPKGLKHFPECCPKGDTKKQCTSNVLIKTCAKHLTNKDLKHLCWNNYNLLEYSSLYPWGTVPSNQELITFGNRLRKIYIHLTQQFIKIGLGISLSYPRAEDNEDSNLTLEVLNKLLRLTALDSFGKTFFLLFSSFNTKF